MIDCVTKQTAVAKLVALYLLGRCQAPKPPIPSHSIVTSGWLSSPSHPTTAFVDHQ